jgi:hypothetical protein
MNEIEQAREAIAFQLAQLSWKLDSEQVLKELEEGATLDVMRQWANTILSLSGPGWRIAVVREKGELPRVEQPTRNYTDVNFGYQLAQQDMLDAGFVQEIREETKG